jgi:hypothetical protein
MELGCMELGCMELEGKDRMPVTVPTGTPGSCGSAHAPARLATCDVVF